MAGMFFSSLFIFGGAKVQLIFRIQNLKFKINFNLTPWPPLQFGEGE
jgi:hypothetical protein